MASLKKPQVTIINREELINMLRQGLGEDYPLLRELGLLIETFDTAIETAMKVEKFFREELADKASLRPLNKQEVRSILNELEKLLDEMFELDLLLDIPINISKDNVITYLEHLKDKSSPGLSDAVKFQLLPLQQLYAKKDDIKQELQKIVAIMGVSYRKTIGLVQSAVKRLLRLLTILMDLFYDARIPISIPGPGLSSTDVEVKSLDTYKRIARQLGLDEVAEQLEKLGNALFTAFFDPKTASINLVRKNIGEVYDNLRHIVEDMKKLSQNLQISDPDLRVFINEIIPLITRSIYEAVDFVIYASRRCRDTRNIIAKLFPEFKPGFNS